MGFHRLGRETETYPRWKRSKTPSAYIRTGRPAGGEFVRYPTGWVKPALTGGGMAGVDDDAGGAILNARAVSSD